MIDISDIQFDSQVGRAIFEVSLDNNSNVGAPMHLASSSRIESWNFGNFNAATRFARELILRAVGTDQLEDNYARLMQSFNSSSGTDKSGGVDLGYYGVNLRMKAISVYNDFFYGDLAAENILKDIVAEASRNERLTGKRVVYEPERLDRFYGRLAQLSNELALNYHKRLKNEYRVGFDASRIPAFTHGFAQRFPQAGASATAEAIALVGDSK